MRKIVILSGILALLAGGASAATFQAFAGGGIAGSCNTNTESRSGDGPVRVSASGAGAACGTDVKARVSDGSVGVFASFASNRFVPGESSPLGSVRASGTLIDTIFFLPTYIAFSDKDLATRADFADGVDDNGLMRMGASFGFTGSANAGTSSTNSFKSKTGFATLEGRINLTATTGGCCGTYDPLDYFKRIEAIGSPNATVPSDMNLRERIGVRFDHDPTAGLGVRIQLGATAGVGGFGGSTGNAVGAASSLNSLGYAKTGPVFDLPFGYTAYSESGFIVDNRLVTPDVAAVPLPAGLPLLLAGLGGLAILRRQQRI